MLFSLTEKKKIIFLRSSILTFREVEMFLPSLFHLQRRADLQCAAAVRAALSQLASAGFCVRLTRYQAAEITLQTLDSHANDQRSFW